MNTHKHTPGPWTFGHAGQCNLVSHTRIHMPGSAGAAVYSMGCCADECDANARLIAAAPELLEALRLMAEHWPAQKPESPAFNAYIQARVAIAKAEGAQ